jgi:Ca2+-binding EF-hand superfamily protein
MNNVFNREREPWIRPWNQEKFDDLYNRDERFFSLVVKGLLSWLNRNIVLYNKSINHFIFNTGSSYLYVESNGYEYNVSETTGEDTMYMKLPRCLIEISDINIPMEELSAPFSRGNYERRSGNQLQGFNAEIRRLPIELTINMKYYLSNFNETIVLLQELIDKLVFQRYFNITYLGKVVQCSIEFPANYNPELNKIDMSSPEPNQRNITFDIKICTNYPLIDTRTEIPTDKVISKFGHEVDLYLKGFSSDSMKKGQIISEDDGFTEFENNLINEKEDIIFDKVEPIHTQDNPIDNPIDNPDDNTQDNPIDNPDDNTQDNPIDNPDDNTQDNPIDNPNDNTQDNTDVVEDKDGITIYTKDIKDSFIKGFDINNDGIIDINDLITKFDTNDDGIIDEHELITILEKMKYEAYDENYDYAESCHYKIDYKDVYYAIKLINKQEAVSAHYDKFAKKIYVTHNDTGETAEIDMVKYKVIN